MSSTEREESADVNIVSSKCKKVQIPEITLHEYLWKDLDKWIDRTAAICVETNRSYTYQELYKKSLSVTKYLKDTLNLKKQDTVAVVLPNIPEFAIVLLGAIQAGLKVTTCNPNFTKDEIQRQFTNSNPQLVFTSREALPVVRQAAEKIPIVEVTNEEDVSTGTISFKEVSSGEDCEPVIVPINETVLLPYSSGTTGLPKGVELSHFNVVANLTQMSSPELDIIMSEDQDVILAFLPFYHMYGLIYILLHTFTMGGKVLCMPKYSTENFIQALRKYKPTVVPLVPFNVIKITENPNITAEDLACVKYFVCASAPLRPSDIKNFFAKAQREVDFVQGYGMTECTTVITSQTKKLPNGVKVGGSGFLVSNTEAKIIPLDSSTTVLGPHRPGEILIRGPQVMKGYFNNPEANKEAFLEGGWFRTGDIAYYDDDEHFFITGRLKELIKVKGFQVAPAELEELLRTHPGVEDVGVIGVPHPVLGEAPKAFVVRKSQEAVEASQLEEFVAEKLVQYKHLAGGVVFVDAIPKSAAGKILRRELKKL